MNTMQFWLLITLGLLCLIASVGVFTSVDRRDRFEFYFYGSLAILLIPSGLWIWYRALILYVL